MESNTSLLFPSALQASADETLDFAKLENFRTIFSFTFPLLITAIASFYSTKFRRNGDVKSLPPGPKPWPIVGCIPEMVKRKPVFRWIHNLMKELNTEISCIRLGSVHVIVVTCPSLSREFLKAQDAVFASRPTSVSTRVTSKGYLTAILAPMGEQWKKMKRVLATEMLSPAKHRWLHRKRLEEADNLVRYVYNQCKGFDEGGVLNVRIAAQHYCGNVTRKLLFNRRFFGEGMEDGGPGHEEKEHLQGLYSILDYMYNFCLSDYLPCLEGFDLDGQEKMIKKANETVAKYHDPIIDERVRQWKDGDKKEAEDWLDNLITLKDSNGNALLSVDEIKGQITEIMIATIDHPSNAVEWTLAEMINQPHILEKAVEELDIVVGKDRLVQESDFSRLNYIKACAREAFRLHPFTAFNVPHVSLSDSTVGDYFIPKGSHVLLSRYGLGRNPKVWDDPLKFKPERHLKDDGSDVVLTESELRFISFSTGSRGCPGVNLGTAMTTMLFARLLQGFNWELPPGESKINLSEERNSLALAKPLLLRARPRLPAHVYRSLLA